MISLLILFVCVPHLSHLSFRYLSKQTLSADYVKLSRVWPCESSYQRHLYYGFVSCPIPFLTIVFALDMLDVSMTRKIQHNFPFSESNILASELSRTLKLDNSLGTVSKDPLWRKFPRKHIKMSADNTCLDWAELERQEIYAYEICISPRQVSRDLWRGRLKIAFILFTYPEIQYL